MEYWPFLSINSFAATSKHITISLPGINLDFSIALTINSNASSFVLIEGAKPPSSPTFVSIFLDFNKSFKFWITKKHL